MAGGRASTGSDWRVADCQCEAMPTEQFEGTIGRTVAESTPWWPDPLRPPDGAPDVIVVVFDDVGFSDFGCFGSNLDTPHLDALAAGGLRYTNFHTTALCSPTRACLLTGRNHHSVGMGVVSNWDTGFPGYRGRIAKSAGTLAEMLRASGYATYAIGKWHLAPIVQTSAAGPYDHWPLQRGFDHFYGFMDGATDQWDPELVLDNTQVPRPDVDGYHVAEDMVDRAISYLGNQVSADPDKRFFLYLAMGAGHYPLQAPHEFIAKYRGRFDEGWDVERSRRLQRQVDGGLLPAGTELAPRNVGVPAWDELDADERRVATALQEAYAGFMDHADAQIGRLVDFLQRTGRYDDTLIIVVSDNGASGEGGRLGSTNYMRYLNGLPSDPADVLAVADTIGGPGTNPMYPQGWAQAGNTPFKRYKQFVHAGGIRDPFIVSWPRRIADGGGVRPQYHHAIDVVPTVLEACGVSAPQVIDSVAQQPIEGVSMVSSWDDAAVPTPKQVQYYEMFGNRAIWRDGWKAVVAHTKGDPFDEDRWELYHTDADPTEIHDLADTEPARLAELVDAWWAEAEQYNVLPLDDRILERFAAAPPSPATNRRRFVYYPGARIPAQAAVSTIGVDYTITTSLEHTAGASGVLWTCGARFAGFVLWLDDGVPVYHYNRAGEHFTIRSGTPLPAGKVELQYRFARTDGLAGIGVLSVNGTEVARGHVDTLGVSLGTVGFCVGQSAQSPVSPAFSGTNPYRGIIHRVVVQLDHGDQSPNENNLID